jgi:hypothetical protein
MKPATHVLVLGAGTSKAYGFPLARDVVEEICFDPEDQLPVERQQKLGIDPFEIVSFRERLRKADPQSVDWYAQQLAPSEFLLAKQLIAYTIGRRESSMKLFTNQVKDHWLRLLGDLLIGDKLSQFPRRNIAIVTFNYERSLDEYLHARLQATFKSKHSEEEIRAAFLRLPIVHIYGQLGTLPGFPTVGLARPYAPISNKDELDIATQGIHLLPEVTADQDLGERKRARELIKAATTAVSFLGFSYAKENLEALDLVGTLGGKQVFGTYQGFQSGDPNSELRDRVHRYGIPAAWVMIDPFPQEPLSVYEALELHRSWLLGPERLDARES